MGDRFPGVVVAENVTKIQRDADKTVGELFVKAGGHREDRRPAFLLRH